MTAPPTPARRTLALGRTFPGRTFPGRTFLGEALFVFVLPALFLWVYVGGFDRPVEAVLPHLRLVAVVWGLTLALRLLASGFGIRAHVNTRGHAVLLGLLAAASVIYYGLVLVGLSYWNNVISWELMWTYGAQARSFAGAMGIHMGAVVVSGVILVALTTTACISVLTRLDWLPALEDRIRRPVRILAAAALFTVSFLEASTLAEGRWVRSGEPVSLTIHSRTATFQNHAVDPLARVRNALADREARAAYRPASDLEARNLVLIVVDGLRPDHMGVLGYARETTPFLTSLDREGRTLLAGALTSACAESLCGLLSLSASSYLHGFSDQPVTLQEVLRIHGYRVHMLLSGDHSNFYGLRRLYGTVDTFRDGSESPLYMNDDSVLLRWIADLPPWDGTPAMFQFHLMSAHLIGHRPEEGPFTPARRYGVWGATATGDGRERSDPVVNFYDNGVVRTDEVIGLLLAGLHHLGYLEGALVVVTSDHGEALGEHGVFGHAKSVHFPVLQVPLLVFDMGDPSPAALPTPVRLPASHVDVAPTLAALLGVPVPTSWQGSDLRSSAPARARTWFMQGQEAGFFDTAAPDGPWKFWVHTRSGAASVYHPGVDPAETCNLASFLPPERLEAWAAALEEEVLSTVAGRAGAPRAPARGAQDPGACRTVIHSLEGLGVTFRTPQGEGHTP